MIWQKVGNSVEVHRLWRIACLDEEILGSEERGALCHAVSEFVCESACSLDKADLYFARGKLLHLTGEIKSV